MIQNLERMQIENSNLNPNSMVSGFGGDDYDRDQSDAFQPKKKILDRLARIELSVDPNEPAIVSFHYEYNDFLEDWGLIDVSE